MGIWGGGGGWGAHASKPSNCNDVVASWDLDGGLLGELIPPLAGSTVLPALPFMPNRVRRSSVTSVLLKREAKADLF